MCKLVQGLYITLISCINYQKCTYNVFEHEKPLNTPVGTILILLLENDKELADIY